MDKFIVKFKPGLFDEMYVRIIGEKQYLTFTRKKDRATKFTEKRAKHFTGTDKSYTIEKCI